MRVVPRGVLKGTFQSQSEEELAANNAQHTAKFVPVKVCVLDVNLDIMEQHVNTIVSNVTLTYVMEIPVTAR